MADMLLLDKIHQNVKTPWKVDTRHTYMHAHYNTAILRFVAGM